MFFGYIYIYTRICIHVLEIIMNILYALIALCFIMFFLEILYLRYSCKSGEAGLGDAFHPV